MSDLLFEIGCEEIPAKALAKTLADLPAQVEAKLAAARLTHAGVRVLGTPRRVAVLVKQLADRQPDLNEEVVGPPVGAAFAPDGTLTKAGQGFAAKNGVDPASLAKREVAGKKGQYVVAVRDVKGSDARALLPQLLAELAASMPWPKSQRWGWGETTFVRPVQWLVALVGEEVVPLQWAGLTAGRASQGHRFLSVGPVEIASADRYSETLRAAHVVVDPEARTELVRAELARLERETGLRVRPDEALLGEVIHLGEYPVGVSGSFDPSFLEVPEEIIVTAMRNHQRYFAMEDQTGKLANRFATMMATVVKDPAVVRKGNEYVIAARLSDAKFFFAEDRKKSFAVWNEKLSGVVFQAKLGERAKTIGHKVQRLVAIARVLAAEVGADPELAAEAAGVAKSDLASSAVGEFPELQGVMGRHYAASFGHSVQIATAIDEHWWPKGQGGALPTSDVGAILALADRMDTLVGAFAVGLEPSGSADPFGLRRAAIGIWQILLAKAEQAGGPGGDHERGARWARAFEVLFESTVAALATQGVLLKDATKVRDFLKARLRGILVDAGMQTQDVDAALARDFTDPVDARARATALAKVPKPAREVFKRIANILDDARGKGLVVTGTVAPDRFTSDVEHRLWNEYSAARAPLTSAVSQLRYADAFDILVQMQPTVAAFFDKGGVMVMDPDTNLRDNRLGLLNAVLERFAEIADFRLLGGAGAGAAS